MHSPYYKFAPLFVASAPLTVLDDFVVRLRASVKCDSVVTWSASARLKQRDKGVMEMDASVGE